MDQSEHSHAQAFSLWPIGVAVGVAFCLVGLLVSWWIVAVGAAVVILFGVAWIYDVTRERRPEAVAASAPAAGEHIERASIGEQEASRKTFLSAMTLGLGAAIGALVSIPPMVFAGLPPFKKGEGFIDIDVDLGPLDTFNEGEWLITQFNMNPEHRRRRQAHCLRPLQRRPARVSRASRSSPTAASTSAAPCRRTARRRPSASARTSPAGGRSRTRRCYRPASAAPATAASTTPRATAPPGRPVRALDRWAYKVADGRLRLIGAYSVDEVEGSGADATLGAYRLAQPGVHIDGLSQVLYPFIPPS